MNLSAIRKADLKGSVPWATDEALCRSHQGYIWKTVSKRETTISTTEGRNKYFYMTLISPLFHQGESPHLPWSQNFRAFPTEFIFNFTHIPLSVPLLSRSTHHPTPPDPGPHSNQVLLLLQSLPCLPYWTPPFSSCFWHLKTLLRSHSCPSPYCSRDAAFLSPFWYPSTWKTKTRDLPILLHQLNSAVKSTFLWIVCSSIGSSIATSAKDKIKENTGRLL